MQRLHNIILVLFIVFFSCDKNEDSVPECESQNTGTIIFVNTDTDIPVDITITYSDNSEETYEAITNSLTIDNAKAGYASIASTWYNESPYSYYYTFEWVEIVQCKQVNFDLSH